MSCQQLHGRVGGVIRDQSRGGMNYTGLDNFLNENCRGEYNYEEQENIYMDRVIKVGIFKNSL
ncbi:unnamed protein product [Meloidogyne enterolobii]|uniref:Uncharacterized protein n=1 Tax=Meloidogyne enterolobii TaxID=390850 RepID=A0ACB1AWT0_MELEN